MVAISRDISNLFFVVPADSVIGKGATHTSTVSVVGGEIPKLGPVVKSIRRTKGADVTSLRRNEERMGTVMVEHDRWQALRRFRSG